MAIGSDAEIGVEFERVTSTKNTGAIRWGPDLLWGYGTLHYPPRYPNGIYPENDKNPLAT